MLTAFEALAQLAVARGKLGEQSKRLLSAADSLALYCDRGGYKQIKDADALRCTSMSAELKAFWQHHARMINDYIKQSPKYNGKLYRGLSFTTADELGLYLDSLRASKPLATLTSFTTSMAVAKQYANAGKGLYKVVLSVQNKSAVLAGAAHEHEAIAPKGTAYKLVAIRAVKSYTLVRVEELGT